MNGAIQGKPIQSTKKRFLPNRQQYKEKIDRLAIT